MSSPRNHDFAIGNMKMPRKYYTPVAIPPNSPVNAQGFVTARPDRPGHLAAYRLDGSLGTTWGYGETVEQINQVISQSGFQITAGGWLVKSD